MSDNYIEVSRQGAVAILTINRPKALNALNADLLDQLIDSIKNIQTADDISVLIITGSGEKAFVAGADIVEMKDMTPLQAVESANRGIAALDALEKLEIPVIAAVNGFALGGGFELALASDFIYASDNAKFAFPEVSLGIMPGFGGTQNLPRLVGPNLAKELIFTGKMLDAETAKTLGIVNQVVPQEQLMEVAVATAEKIAANGKMGVIAAKKTIVNGMNMPKNEAYRYESSQFGLLFSTDDQKEGMQAFVDKRKPQFSNR